MTRKNSRRDFLRDSTLAGVGFWVAGASTGANAKGPNDKINFAGVGIGGKGHSDIMQAANLGPVVAICDIDDNFLGKKADKFAQAKKYNDFRKMLEVLDKQIDAVVVSTPDHTHAVAAMMAMKMKKHVYVQKPLTHSVYEARLMRETAAQAPFTERLKGAARAPLPPVSFYYDLLSPLCARLDIWHTIYNHPLSNAAAIVEWVKATGLKPFLDPLGDEERSLFLERYTAAIAAAYPPMQDGKALLRFPRLFIVARRAG